MSRYRYRVIEVPNDQQQETILLRDDGYRIWFKWIDGKPVNDDGDWSLWAEYKQCNYPGIGGTIADALMIGSGAFGSDK